jgi:hypothetical protein
LAGGDGEARPGARDGDASAAIEGGAGAEVTAEALADGPSSWPTSIAVPTQKRHPPPPIASTAATITTMTSAVFELRGGGGGGG